MGSGRGSGAVGFLGAVGEIDGKEERLMEVGLRGSGTDSQIQGKWERLRGSG